MREIESVGIRDRDRQTHTHTEIEREREIIAKIYGFRRRLRNCVNMSMRMRIRRGMREVCKERGREIYR